MSIDKLFFMLPSKGKFLNSFAHNEQLKAQADQFWRQLDGLTILLFGAAVLIGVVLAIYYYTGYNNLPGRHYKIKHWLLWAGISLVLGYVATFAIEALLIKTNLKTDINALCNLCALNNALYCLAFYFVTSFIWCNFFSTNAYKFLKV